MADIFLSYAREDQARAESFAAGLRTHGWTVWSDRLIPAGMSWKQAVTREAAEARCMVVLLSEASVKSRYVDEEAELEFRRNIVFPILIDKVKPPFGFLTIQAADWGDWDASPTDLRFERLSAQIVDRFGPPSSSSASDLQRRARVADALAASSAEAWHIEAAMARWRANRSRAWALAAVAMLATGAVIIGGRLLTHQESDAATRKTQQKAPSEVAQVTNKNGSAPEERGVSDIQMPLKARRTEDAELVNPPLANRPKPPEQPVSQNPRDTSSGRQSLTDLLTGAELDGTWQVSTTPVTSGGRTVWLYFRGRNFAWSDGGAPAGTLSLERELLSFSLLAAGQPSPGQTALVSALNEARLRRQPDGSFLSEASNDNSGSRVQLIRIAH